MGRERDVHRVVDIEPFRMVVHLLGHLADGVHQREPGAEILGLDFKNTILGIQYEKVNIEAIKSLS